MGLVSGLYRLAPSDTYPTKDEAELRLRARVRRLVAQHGKAEVLRRIRAYPVAEHERLYRSWLVLTAEAEGERQRGGTI